MLDGSTMIMMIMRYGKHDRWNTIDENTHDTLAACMIWDLVGIEGTGYLIGTWLGMLVDLKAVACGRCTIAGVIENKKILKPKSESNSYCWSR